MNIWSDENMIQLKYVKGEIFVYDIDIWNTLRRNHRIVGQIIGSTSFIPSLPAKLQPEEALLLIDKNLAEIHETSSSPKHNVETTKKFEETLLRAQHQEYRQVRKVQLETIIDKIVEKRKKLGDKRSKEEIFNEELDKSSVVTKENMVWPILLKYDKPNLALVSRDTICCLTTTLKSTIFQDLWHRGYYITNGEKFGGDFLVYFGDPIVHHAIFIVKCIEENNKFSPTDLIAFGRLGVAVKKRAVLGSLKKGKICYITINWLDA